ncbi:unnamed protein product [Acanthoscelides obtectus]|uniref:MADF domain-containing protein n=1 Tax=Acanthoscelides obtectus TaxID=200917 RepID=A0A9P0JQF3_ACAOB|nr:unnamed protein product [Acanthoscelides obtectus]CAK1663807.1 hypothetical protein AOBTE_LOCUS23865 [Acanthoscelides obtectus]
MSKRRCRDRTIQSTSTSFSRPSSSQSFYSQSSYPEHLQQKLINRQATSRKWSTDDINTFLSVYEEHPCLWNYKVLSFKDRIQRDAALKKIVEVISHTA